MNGRFYDRIMQVGERKLLGPIRAELLGGLSGRILELGAGTGANFAYYPAGARVLAIEPSRSMLERANDRARDAAATVELMQGDDTLLDTMPPHTFDAVVATLVLCSVPDPARTLQRVKRVLAVGGTFVMLEHTRSSGLGAVIQRLLNPLWRPLADNCHLTRDPERLVREAGFALAPARERAIPPPAFRLAYGIASNLAD